MDDRQRHSELFKIDNFFAEIDKRRNSMPIFLATDSTEVVSAFQARYGNRVLCQPCGPLSSRPHIAENGSDKEIVRAFCDMICLSKSEILLGTYLSTFTECAWWFGNCRQHVVVV
jgi:hypothetical protein